MDAVPGLDGLFFQPSFAGASGGAQRDDPFSEPLHVAPVFTFTQSAELEDLVPPCDAAFVVVLDDVLAELSAFSSGAPYLPATGSFLDAGGFGADGLVASIIGPPLEPIDWDKVMLGPGGPPPVGKEFRMIPDLHITIDSPDRFYTGTTPTPP